MIAEIRFRGKCQQGFIYEQNGLLNVFAVQHFHRGVHITKGN
jgi:hypothetical protein